DDRRLLRDRGVRLHGLPVRDRLRDRRGPGLEQRRGGRPVDCFRIGAKRRYASPRMALIETEEAARRLARAIASDLSLYNEEKIVQGVTHDNLFNGISEEIEEGRALYKSRVAPELYPKNFYDRELVDILIKAKGHIKSKIW